jgi:hypothetical protein
MNFPFPSVTPEALRSSVSIFSFTTGALAGINFFNSWDVAALQRAGAAVKVAAKSTNRAVAIDVWRFIFLVNLYRLKMVG